MIEEKNITDALENARATLSAGGKIVVFGWKDSNHSPETRQFVRIGGKVEFFDDTKQHVRCQKSFVLFTRFISHSQVARLRKVGDNVYPHPLGTGEIKNILLQVKDLLLVAETKTESIVPDSKTPERSLADLEAGITRGVSTMDEYDRLAAAFQKEAATKSDQALSSFETTELLRSIEGLDKTAPKLADEGWLERFMRPGQQRAGAYKAGPLLRERLSSGATEPTDAIEKMQWLIERKPLLEQQLAEAEERVRRIKAEIHRSEMAMEMKQKLLDL